MHPRYPVLHRIDHARGPGHHPFVDDPDAGALECYAAHLVDAYCSDMVWLTGDIAEGPLLTICDLLERERSREPIVLYVTAPEGIPATPGTPMS